MRLMRAYWLKDSDTVVTKKSHIENAKEEDYQQINLLISEDEIMQMNDEIELIGAEL